jgi:hypothetical protein
MSKKAIGKRVGVRWATIFAVPISIFLAAGVASITSFADGQGDVTVSVSVVDSTPSGQPAQQVVQLDEGQVVTDAKVTIKLVGLEPFSFVQVFAQSTPVLIASGYADKDGIFETVAKLPPTLEVGSHQVLAAAQKKGQSKPTLVSLVKFKVSADGVLGNTSSGKHLPVTESPAPTTTAKPQELLDGVLFIGGLDLKANPSFQFLGPKGQASFTVMNAYKRSYSLTMDQTVDAWGLFPISEVRNYPIVNLRPKEARVVTKSLPHIGHWGLYVQRLTITPPVKLDDLSLPVVHRESVFLVVPVLPLVVLGLVMVFEAVRRFFIGPYVKGWRLLKTLVLEVEESE